MDCNLFRFVRIWIGVFLTKKKKDMETIKFDKNWNSKLNNKAFTTIRLKNDEKYKVGEIYFIEDKSASYNRMSVIRDIFDFKIGRISMCASMVDMGVTPDLAIKILKEYYPDVTDWNDEIFSLITLETIIEIY